ARSNSAPDRDPRQSRRLPALTPRKTGRRDYRARSPARAWARHEEPRTLGHERRIVTFQREAARFLPGYLYCFNIADLKRRNGHLGHGAGDKDIEELE